MNYDLEFGIDFGTTNSACTGIQDKKFARNYSDEFGDPFPSIVIIDRDTGVVYCGREAWLKKEALRESCEIITSIKTHLGTDKVFHIAGKPWSPEMVAAQIFLGLKEKVKRWELELKEAVVAVPVNFLPEKRVALRSAAEMAGVNIKAFISEPTAALFGHYSAIGMHSKIAVFDWGGGTLDVAVIENRGGMVKELATGGINLAGDHIDRKLAEWVHEALLKKGSKRVAFEAMAPAARDKMIEACEKAKRDLTDEDLVRIKFLDYGEIGSVDVSIDIDKFSLLIESEIGKAIECFDGTLNKAKISIEEIGCILMVGGSVNLRPLEIKALKRWKDKVIFPEKSAWLVSNGAAQLSIDPGDYISSQTIGVTMSDGSLYPLVQQGSIVSNFEKEVYFALVEDSRTANIIISDGNGKYIGSLDVPAFGFLNEKIGLKVTVDNNLIFNIVAKSTNRSKAHSCRWQYTGITLNYRLPTLIEAAVGEENENVL